MSAFLASLDPKPARSFPGAWPAKPLHRKCACGESGSACHCGGCRKETRSAPAMHDFSRMSVHAGLTASSVLPELGCLGRVREDAGDTGCDVEKGVPDVVINAPSVCYRHCTERHEEVHRKDLAPCCKKAHAAWGAAKGDDKKTQVQDKMNHWVERNADWLQCRAYAESVRCADEFLVAHCGKKAETESPQRDQPRATDQQPAKMAGGPEEAPGEQPSSRLAEDAESKDQPQVDPARCCYTVGEYRRKSNWRREAFCKEGNKGPTPCPF